MKPPPVDPHHPAPSYHSACARITTTALVAFALASYFYIRDAQRNDFERLGNPWLLAFFFLCILTWVLCYTLLAERALAQGTDGDAHATSSFPYVGAVALLLSFPVGSRDVFAYAFYGKMWGQYHADPFFHAPTEFRDDPWYPLLQAWWKEGSAGYGPLFLLQTRLLYALCGDNLVATIAGYKLVNLALLLAGMAIFRALASEVAGQPAGNRLRATLWASSPLILFEGLSSAHNDLTVAVLLLAALLCWLRRQGFLFGCLWALTYWYKWYSVVVLPVFFLWEFKRGPDRNASANGLLAALAGVLLVSACALVPFGTAAVDVVLKPFTIKVGQLLFPTELPPTLWPLFAFYLESGWFELSVGRTLFDVSRYTLAVLLGAAVLARRGRQASSRRWSLKIVSTCY